VQPVQNTFKFVSKVRDVISRVDIGCRCYNRGVEVVHRVQLQNKEVYEKSGYEMNVC